MAFRRDLLTRSRDRVPRMHPRVKISCSLSINRLWHFSNLNTSYPNDVCAWRAYLSAATYCREIVFRSVFFRLIRSPGQCSIRNLGLRSRIDPEQIPSPVEVVEADEEAWEGRQFTTLATEHVPLSTTNYVSVDQGAYLSYAINSWK